MEQQAAVIYIGGTFDCLHEGHIRLFKRAAKMGRVVVSLNRDEFVERYKRKPVMPFASRFAVLQELRCIDTVIVNEGDEDSKPSILKAKATHILHGDDWKDDALLKQMGLTNEWLQQQHIHMLYLPYTTGISTTDIIKRFADTK